MKSPCLSSCLCLCLSHSAFSVPCIILGLSLRYLPSDLNALSPLLADSSPSFRFHHTCTFSRKSISLTQDSQLLLHYYPTVSSPSSFINFISLAISCSLFAYSTKQVRHHVSLAHCFIPVPSTSTKAKNRC